MSLRSIPSAELFNKLVAKEALFILDVRNEEDFNDWKIEGEKVEHLNVPYFDLLDGVEGIIDQLPKDRETIVVCAKEGSSKMVAEMLDEANVATAYLEGGMKTWSEYLYQGKVFENDDLKIYQLIRVGKGCLSYMVISGKEALIVDPSRFIDVYDDLAKREGVAIRHIVDSHLHADHISGGRELAEKLNAHYYIMKSEGVTFDVNALENRDVIEFEKVKLQVLAIKTPGHTPGSVSFFVNDQFLFSGDTIFVGGLGRPDLGGKAELWAKDLYATVYEKVAKFTDDVVVLPSHYADLDNEMNKDGYIGALLGDIRKQNSMMNHMDEQTFVDEVKAQANYDTPPNFKAIVEINKGTLVADEEKRQELEIGPNRCALHHTN